MNTLSLIIYNMKQHYILSDNAITAKTNTQLNLTKAQYNQAYNEQLGKNNDNLKHGSKMKLMIRWIDALHMIKVNKY